jgi:hypothetical protein
MRHTGLHAAAAAIAFAPIALSACGGSGSSEPAGPPACATTLTLSAVSTAVSPPTFRWEPSCAVNALEVLDDARTTVMWRIVSDGVDGERRIQPGVLYSVAPAGAHNYFPRNTDPMVDPLVPGRAYWFRIGTLIGAPSPNATFQPLAELRFTR